MDLQDYDAIIVGAGQGGYPLAMAFAAAGKRTAIIERAEYGGTCVNYGCTPTKTMVANARVAYLARRGQDYGVHTGEVHIDMEQVRERKRKIVSGSVNYLTQKVEETDHLDGIKGEARFTGAKELIVRLNEGGEKRLRGAAIFINTGLSPRLPPVEGLSSVDYLTNVSIIELGELPKHLVIIGGGYVGLEFGQMFRRFGSEVTIVQQFPHIMHPREDDDIIEEIENILREDGIHLLLETEARRVSQDEKGIHLTVEHDGTERVIHGSHLMVASGRKPNTEALDLGAAGVEVDERGFIIVNDRLETAVEGVYALGDVKGGPAFTHISYDDFRVLKANLLDGGQATITDRLAPYTLFIDPEYAAVGLNEKAARKQGINYRVATLSARSVARAREMGETRGLWKAVIDAETDQILGCALLGVNAGEVMGAVQIAMMGKLPYTALRDAAFSHPTLVESLNNLFATLD